MNLNRAHSLCLLALAAIGSSAQQEYGVVTGQVLDVRSTPIAGIEVTACGPRERPHTGPYLKGTTDSRGHFKIEGMTRGTYILTGKNEASGYPGGCFAFYSDEGSPTVHIWPDSAGVVAIVRLGPKAGVLAGAAVDSRSGEPTPGSLKLWKLSDPSDAIQISVNGKFRVLVPAGQAVGAQFVSAAHAEWSYPTGSLKLEPGEIRSIEVRLEPTRE